MLGLDGVRVHNEYPAPIAALVRSGVMDLIRYGHALNTERFGTDK